jgi:hypothetical protein
MSKAFYYFNAAVGYMQPVSGKKRLKSGEEAPYLLS